MSLEDAPTCLPKSQERKNTNANYMDEYIVDIEKLMVKTTILNIITLIDECENPMETKQLVNTLKNLIIIHGKILRNLPVFINIIECSLKNYELKYDSFIIYKMLFNLKNNKLKENYHFRVITETIKKFPPLTIEERTILENKLKFTRYSYQAKKKRKPFIVDQIVGAKDKENNWWLSRILGVYNDKERDGYWYYVRFEGWLKKHDEWIYSESFRINTFNPKKHFLKK